MAAKAKCYTQEFFQQTQLPTDGLRSEMQLFSSFDYTFLQQPYKSNGGVYN